MRALPSLRGCGRRLPAAIPCLLAVVSVAATGTPACAWGVGHNDASWLAATVSPEPFRSHPDLCMLAHYPDAMQDHAVGHGRDGYLRRLFTLEAIEALRAGDAPKALFFASAATHYLTDRACIAHAGRAWYHTEGDPWTKYLPQRYQSVQVPYEKKEVYYPHLKGTARDTVLNFPEPEYATEAWRKYQGSTNAYFDSLPSVRRLVTPDLQRDPGGWTFTDFDQYARWYATFIALDMIDPASLGAGQLRLRDAVGIKAVCVEELINGAAQDTALYRYLRTAADTVVEPSADELLAEPDPLVALAGEDPLVLISQTAPWPVERAAQVLGMELLRAARRLAVVRGAEAPDRSVGSFVRRVTSDKIAHELAQHSAVVLVTPEDDKWASELQLPPLPTAKAGVIAVRRAEADHRQVVLRGATVQDTLYLVDYLLDLTWDPLHGRWPAREAADIYRDVWAGWRLILDLRAMSGQAAVEHARALPHHHLQTRAEDARKCTEAFREGFHAAASEEQWWRHFLLETPLPDGRRVPELIEKGTDYSSLMNLVRE